MDIVDAQVHLGREGHEHILAQMDALGISGAVLVEFWGRDEAGRPTPGYQAGDVWRRVTPLSEAAVLSRPDRFTYIATVDRRDPDLESLIAMIASAPAARGLRVMPLPDAEAFADGAYEPLFALAQDAQLAVFVVLHGKAGLLPRYIEKFPRLSVTVDHCGTPWGAGDTRSFNEVLQLARHPNVTLKWAHAQDQFGVKTYPYEGLFPFLRSAIDAFGAERLMWAGDHSAVVGHSWAELLFYLRDSCQLSALEKEQILGGTVRRLLGWPA
jgi:predicted TIM-barrel fold metal-dependent hydrolase